MEALSLALESMGSWQIIVAAFGGVAWGIVGGALPGISPSIAMALLLPFTYGMAPAPSIILLASTYVGAEFGGSIPAILINTPGTNAAAATVIDGYALQKQGRGGEALGISLTCGIFGTIVGIFLLMTVTEPLANVALFFTPASYFSLGILGISVIATLSEGNMVKGMMTATMGLMIATIGTDPFSGVNRFTFDLPELLDGIPYILIMVGIYAIAELYVQAGKSNWEQPSGRVKIKLPSLRTCRRILPAASIGSGIGAFEGVMPGAGGTIAAFMSYSEARRWSKTPEEFGHGALEGVAAPESANNTVSCTALIPTLSLGIPGSNSTAILLGGLMLHGLVPGPLLFQQNGDVVYGLYGGLMVAVVALFIVGKMVMTPCLWIVSQPRPLLMAGIFALVFSGVYSIHNDIFDLYIVIGAGVLGYFLKVAKFPFLPLVLGVILGYMIESNYRRALLMSGNDHGIFLEDPFSLAMLSLAVLFIILSLGRNWYQARKKAAQAALEA